MALKFTDKAYIVVNPGEVGSQQVLVKMLTQSRDRVGMDAKIISLVSPQEEKYVYEANEDIIIHTPDFRKLVKRPDWIATFNKLGSIKFFVENFDLDDECVLLFVDPDMLFINKFDIVSLLKDDINVAAQKWVGYSVHSCFRSTKGLCYCEEDEESTWMFPFAIRFGDLKKAADSLYNTALDVYKITDDWMVDMYIFIHAFNQCGFNIEYLENLGVANDWDLFDPETSNMLHYTQPVFDEDGKLYWGKRISDTYEDKLEVHDYMSESDKIIVEAFNNTLNG